ncbi:conserved oligomeric Golgi complex subunit 2, partial [Tremellales sp. Uapishka_1]
MVETPAPPHEILRVINAYPVKNQTGQDDDSELIPAAAWLEFPPFPPAPPGVAHTPFHLWQSAGVWIPSHSAENVEKSAGEPQSPTHTDEVNDSDLYPHDAHHNALIAIGIERAPGAQQARYQAKRLRRQEKLHLTVQLARENAFKIGEEGSGWVEPLQTCHQSYDVRLLPVYFRSALGIRPEFPGPHWPGSGVDGDPFRYTARAKQDWDPLQFSQAPFLDERNYKNQEVCVLLSKPMTAIRGFLALARREAEAGWDFEPALKLARIVAAFMSYLTHYKVISDPYLEPSILRATALARAAPQKLIEAKKLEDTLSLGTSFNRAMWSVWGGTYGSAERARANTHDQGDHDSVKVQKQEVEMDKEDGGWGVQELSDDRPDPLSAKEAMPMVQPAVSPLLAKDLKLLHYLPYARRRVSAVYPPLPPSADLPAYASNLYRLVTVPAPWTPEERWKVPRYKTHDNMEEAGRSDFLEEKESMPLEEEKATMPEPDELIIWVEESVLTDTNTRGQELVGMGLRGGWGMVGKPGGQEYESWWVFKAKDFVLPSFWQSTPEERLADAHDPEPVFPAEPYLNLPGQTQEEGYSVAMTLIQQPEYLPSDSRTSTSSIGRSLDLPSLQPLSHQHPLLSAPTFDVDTFLLSRLHIPLDELRSELREYLGVLREELVQLINDDYEEFISLGTGLRGESERLRRLEKPLSVLRNEVEHKLDERAALREEKALLDLLQRLFETLARAETLLESSDDEDKAKLVNRVAGEYTQLVYLVSKARAEGCLVMESISEIVSRYESWLLSTVDALKSGEEDLNQEDAALRLAASAILDVNLLASHCREIEICRSLDLDGTLNIPIDRFENRIITILTRRCSESLKLVRSVASQFRAAPSKSAAIQASYFIPNILKPLQTFLDSRPSLKERYGPQWSTTIADHVFSGYAAVLASVRKTEDLLRRHRKGKKNTFSLFGSSNASTEADVNEEEARFKSQMQVDTSTLAEIAKDLGVDVDSLSGWAELSEVVHRAAE